MIAPMVSEGVSGQAVIVTSLHVEPAGGATVVGHAASTAVTVHAAERASLVESCGLASPPLFSSVPLSSSAVPPVSLPAVPPSFPSPGALEEELHPRRINGMRKRGASEDVSCAMRPHQAYHAVAFRSSQRLRAAFATLDAGSLRDAATSIHRPLPMFTIATPPAA